MIDVLFRMCKILYTSTFQHYVKSLGECKKENTRKSIHFGNYP